MSDQDDEFQEEYTEEEWAIIDKQIFEGYLEGAEGGDAKSQYELGCLYSDGEIVKRSYIKAMMWMKRAARQGYLPALEYLGRYFSHLCNQRPKYARARMWLKRAAKQGSLEALCGLACLYLFGHGVAVDEAKAVALLKEAAQKDWPDAQVMLGWCYEHGRGTRKNKAKACAWYDKAVEAGYAEYKRTSFWNGEDADSDFHLYNPHLPDNEKKHHENDEQKRDADSMKNPWPTVMVMEKCGYSFWLMEGVSPPI